MNTDKKGLRLNPMNIREDDWYYEEDKGICVVHQVRNKNGAYIQTDQFIIPWKKLLESVRRKYNIKGNIP